MCIRDSFILYLHSSVHLHTYIPRLHSKYHKALTVQNKNVHQKKMAAPVKKMAAPVVPSLLKREREKNKERDAVCLHNGATCDEVCRSLRGPAWLSRRRKMPGPPMALVWATSVFTVFLGHQPLNMNLRATSARFLLSRPPAASPREIGVYLLRLC